MALLSVFSEPKGAIEWVQENPNILSVTLKGQPTRFITGNGLCVRPSAQMNRLPSGHPEGLYEAFANIYKCYISALLKKLNGEDLDEGDLDFPTVDDGISGVKFIHACVESSRKNAAWVEI